MSMNMVDGVDFDFECECIWILHAPGTSGDLIGSIIDKHYINTGSNYYGIDDNGQVMFLPIDYKIESRQLHKFNNMFLYSLADNMASRNLNYSLLDNVIFTSHRNDYNEILSNFKKAKIINITNETDIETNIINRLSKIKNGGDGHKVKNKYPIKNKRIFNIRFADISKEETFERD